MDARKCAASYLSARPRTEKQLRDHLARKGCGKEDIRETVAELKEYGYIDDREYCRMYFEYGFEKKRGTGRIIRELKDRGVSSDVIECVYSSLEYVPDQYEAAMSAAVEGAPPPDEEEIAEMPYEDRRRLAARTGRRLASRGFSQDVVYRVIRKLYRI